MALRRKIVNFVGANSLYQAEKIRTVRQITVVKREMNILFVRISERGGRPYRY